MGESGIRDVFINEAREIIDNLESDIIQLEENPEEKEIINRIFRYFHTLKGSSGIAGLHNIHDFTHNLETLLDMVRSDTLDVSKGLINVILNSIDWIKLVVFHSEAEGEIPPTSLVDDILTLKGGEKLDHLSDQKLEQKAEKDVSQKYYRVRVAFRDTIFESGIDPLMIIEDLLSIGETIVNKASRKQLPKLSELDPEKCYLKWDVIIKTNDPIDKIENVFLFVNDEFNEIKIEDVTKNFEKQESEQYIQEKKIGEILVDKGVISENDLDEVIEIQDQQKNKIGSLLVEKGLATENDINDALKEQEKIKKKIEISTVRVDTTKLDNLMNLLGEIVIGQASLAGIADDLDSELGFQLKNALYGLDRITREFQEQIMSIRMIPVGPTFEQFRRFIRDSAQKINKDIKLIIEGGETELDKTVIERINDPLKHMIRNAIDHGLENESERLAAGKSETGYITLKAYHQEGNVYIEIHDDGKGIDTKKVKEKAIKQGLLKPDEKVTKDKLFSFLFHPGFSTADKVGGLSGRGVGMDVVKTNITELRGSVEIKSEIGSGTIVRIKLPLTLAIIDGMAVNIGENIYIIPLLSIVESMQPKKEEIKTVEGKGEVVLFRGEYVSFIRLYDLFKVKPHYENPWEGLVIIVESGNTRVGLLIDDLIGEQQIVIKSLDSYITTSRAISGAAILGDGKVALIIDIHGLVEDINN